MRKKKQQVHINKDEMNTLVNNSIDLLASQNKKQKQVKVNNEEIINIPLKIYKFICGCCKSIIESQNSNNNRSCPSCGNDKFTEYK